MSRVSLLILISRHPDTSHLTAFLHKWESGVDARFMAPLEKQVDKVFVKSSTYFLICSQWSLCEAILSSYGTISNIIQHTEAWRKRRYRA